MYETVLVPTDGSATSSTAVDHAIAAADRHDATVHLLYVVDVRVARTAPGLAIGEVRSALEEEGQRVTEELASRVRSAGLDVERRVAEGVPDDEILTYADEIDAGLVVMGSSGKSQRERMRLGSVTENVFRADQVPVLSVPGQ